MGNNIISTFVFEKVAIECTMIKPVQVLKCQLAAGGCDIVQKDKSLH